MAVPKIESYEHGKMRIDGREFEQDLIICGDRIHLCWESYNRKNTLGRRYVATLLEHNPEMLIIGLGAGAKLGLSKKAIALLEETGVEWHALPTRNASRLYNKMRGSKRIVALLRLES